MPRKRILTEEQKKIKKREWYIKNKDKILAMAKQRQKAVFADDEERKKYCEKWRLYTRNNYEARLLASVKSKCKSKNIPFDLIKEDIVIPEFCPKTGIKLVVHEERGKYYDTPSIDRIVPELGYVRGNIQIVSLWYNVAKFSWSEDVMLDMCRRVVNIHDAIR